MPLLLNIANKFGNVNVVSISRSKRYVHVEGKRLGPLCDKLKIRYAPALVGFQKHRGHYFPKIDGVVVAAASQQKLVAAISERVARSAKRKPRLPRLSEAERAAARLGIHPDGRLARAVARGEIDDDLALLLDFKADWRHNYTDYEKRLHAGCDRDEARAARADLGTIPADWPAYLERFGFTGPQAEALAGVLRDPTKCHPTWFYEAMLSLERYRVDLTTLSYETIREAIDRWRRDRQQAFDSPNAHKF